MKRYKIVVLGHIINPKSDKKCENFPQGALLLAPKIKNGEVIYKIQDIGPKSRVLKNFDEGFQLIDYSENVIIPSFFDMHFHWVQDEVREKPKANLLHWLEN